MGRRLFVGNLPYTVTQEDLTEHFAPHGALTSVQLVIARDTGRSKGFGFVEYETEAGATAANAAEHVISGRTLTVNEARPKPKFDGGRAGAGRVPGWGSTDPPLGRG